MPIPTLTTPRITLRAFRATDWHAFTAMNADPAVRQFLGGAILTPEQSWTQMEAILGQWMLRGYGLFAVEINGRFAGRVGILHPAEWPEPELAWSLAQPFWGQGFATEAAAEARRWAFAQFGWDHLVSYILPTNQASRRVAEKLNAVREGSITLRGFTADIWTHPAPNHGVMV
jgi:RimJ/RimL family protein N-acetyltransferase